MMEKKLFQTERNTQTVSLPERSEIEEKYKWDTAHIYSSEDLWEKDFKWIEEQLPNYKNFYGKLNESAEILEKCLKFDDEVGIKLERLYLYSMLSKDSDMRVTKYQAMNDRITSLYANISSASSFIRPEILKIPADKLFKMIEENDGLKMYKHLIDNLIRAKTHTLSSDQEKILAMASELELVSHNAFSMFTNSDLKF
ncbi:MAG: oligoendopeptidase F, partial [Ignavibacteriaceae bacterium]